MNVLLSIKPEFGDKILDGEKHYEFRKTGFRNPDVVDVIIMYASAPVQKVIGYFTIGEVIESCPETLWERFGAESGLRKERFMNYFGGCSNGYAIEIDESHRLSTPIDPRKHSDEFSPPVSFQYVNGQFDFLLGE